MAARYYFLLNILLLLPFLCPAQSMSLTGGSVTGIVYDAKTKDPLPFATIRIANSSTGTISGLDGRFEIGGLAHSHTLEVSCLGYKKSIVMITGSSLSIYLHPGDNPLNEVVVKPPYDKIRRIMNRAIANKPVNNPDLYDRYRCNVYYKMKVDLIFPDSVMTDTAERNRERQDFVNNQHLLMSETYSRRTWKKPQKLQEDVLASRFSGFKNSMFTSLVTDVLPFHAYSDYLTLNGKDFHNPVSRGYEQYYKLNLSDEVVTGNDTVWVLSFLPRGNNVNGIKGSVYISSNGFAISHIIARSSDTVLKLNVRIEQEYAPLPYANGATRWFPKSLNYIVTYHQLSSQSNGTFQMRGNSQIDSVNWQEDPLFKFDKAHTVKLAAGATTRADSILQTLRPLALDRKEARTYKCIDSIGNEIKLDKLMGYMAKLPEGKVPIGIIDFDLRRIFSYNYYEHIRLGLGMQTNEKLVSWLSVGAWAGYGFDDEHWKYGMFAEAYGDVHKESAVSVAYNDDIYDPGRVHINRDLDKNYLNRLLLRRVDRVQSYTIAARKKFGYWDVDLSATDQQITPLYQYALAYGTDQLTAFHAQEATLGLRYAFAERTAPLFNSYYRLGSDYPVWYGKVTAGVMESGTVHTPYTQALTAIHWHKHINRAGYEHILVEAGKVWSNDPLPLSKLFAGNGYRVNSRSLLKESIYTFGGMMTIYPYQFYTDQFINLIFRHDFDWKLYQHVFRGTSFSSAPNLCLQYNVLYGTLAHPEAQQLIPLAVPDNAYHEGGLLLNNLLRIKYANVYYLTLNTGYFHQLTSFAHTDGKFVLGLGFEL